MSESLEASAAEVAAAVKQQRLEGVIAKRRRSRYEPGKRSGAWVKLRVNKGSDCLKCQAVTADSKRTAAPPREHASGKGEGAAKANSGFH